MRGRISALVWAAAAVLLTLSLVWYPEMALEAAREGMTLFLKVVFPSLLPFFILSEIMLGLGVVHFIGVLFEPHMRPLFNVPGEGAFVLSMGLAAGYPMDAVITSRFRKQDLCTQIEGERMLAFSNTADPVLALLRVMTPAANPRSAGVMQAPDRRRDRGDFVSGRFLHLVSRRGFRSYCLRQRPGSGSESRHFDRASKHGMSDWDVPPCLLGGAS
ncbi:MAG TPA: nucleoside recognition domain-containing protein [Symbiobacteriaceae bacterium]|nr:nucleoside recognition domain-containing protein [Symbiobacteriaceae bacterium]